MEECKEDPFRLLPDHILSFILSFLTIWQAAQTSVLSRRWEHVWKSIPSISFNRLLPDSSAPAITHLLLDRNIARAVDCVFSSHTGRVFMCELVYDGDNYSMSDLERWIKQLSGFGIQNLRLICRCYGIPSLDDFSNRDLKTARPFVGCVELRTLRLDSVNLTDQVLYDIIRCCVVLEELVLCDCELLSQIRIYSTTLKSLKLMKLRNVLRIDIEGKSLEMLSVHELYQASADSDLINNIVQNSPNLRTMILRECSLRNLQIQSSNLQFLDFRMLGIKENIVVNAPRLASLRMGGVECKGSFDIATPNLQSLSTHAVDLYKGLCWKLYANQIQGNRLSCQSNADLLARCSHLFGVDGGRASTPFESLNMLSINLHLNDLPDAVVLAYLLKICLHLQELTVMIEDGTHDNGNNGVIFKAPIYSKKRYKESPYWEGQDVFSYMTHHLKTVELKGFRGKLLEFDFARFVIKRAVALKRMTIECGKDLSQEEKQAISLLKSLPKASVNAGIIIKHEPRKQSI